MKFFLPIIFLLGISGNALGKEIREERSNNEDDLSYQELINMNVSCYPLDSCAEDRTYESPVLDFGDKCSCHSECWEYGTCCIDSPYRFKPPIYECVETNYGLRYIVHRCPDNTDPDSIWRNNCERKDGEEDILMISPVTSLDTSRTYKNYYCFRCHETTDKYLSWDLEVFSIGKPHIQVENIEYILNSASVYSVAYNKTEKTWVAFLNEFNVFFPVSLRFTYPDKVQKLKAEPEICDSFSVRADCHDKRLNAKCLAYSAVIYSGVMPYKNVHCALCNNNSLDELTCYVNGEVGYPESGGRRVDGFAAKVRRCGKTKDRTPETCKGEFEKWVCPTKKCIKLACPEPEKVLKNNKCVNP